MRTVIEDSIVIAEGIDTYVEPDKKTSTLSLQRVQRYGFFCSRPQLKSLLLREPANPIVEEGFCGSFRRSRNGEYFLTPEGMTLLVEKKMLEARKADIRYNLNNIFIVRDNLQLLYDILANLDLHNGDDAKVIYIEEVHAVPFYIRKENDKIKCFIVDSTVNFEKCWPIFVVIILMKCFQDPIITINSIILQKDYYSCSVFAIKVLKYFSKHGADIFPYIESFPENFCEETGCNLLNRLMPVLSKMSHDKVSFSEEELDTIVSVKANMTLREYIQKYTIQIDERKRNSAALIKRYKFFDELHSYISERTEEKISDDISNPLPESLGSICQKYSQRRLG